MKANFINLLSVVALLFSLSSIDLSAQGTALSRGTWVKKTQKISGAWKIVDLGKHKELKMVGFKTKKAPDLQVFLSPHTAKVASNKNASAGALVLGKLKSLKGDQSYRIPSDVDLSKYHSILIHCKKYSKLWGAASLKLRKESK